ncbi:MAG TPA: glycosyltransferase family 4 protein [Thermoanaerobaculia bacterium]|nr:glycosyltransferase family 4 protein [Thermoanaerobaculia bacterium]
MRPLVLTENYPPDRGGMAQSCDRIVRSLRAAGLPVDVAHLGRKEHRPRLERQEGGVLLASPFDDDPSHAINLLWNEVRRLPEAPSHVVAFGGATPVLAGPALAAWLGVPLVTLLRGNDFDTGLFSLRRGWALRDALARSAAVATVSRDHLRKVSALYPSADVRFIPNGIDPAEWSLVAHDLERAARWRAEHVSEGKRVLGMFGHLKQKKGGAFFLDALRRAGVDGRLHLLIVGDAEPEMIAHLQSIESAVSWTHVPFVDRFELLPFYAVCDAVVIPSLYDGMPNVLLEAGALGVPPVASTAGGMADLLTGGENSLTFPPGDVHECRRALVEAAGIPIEALRRMGERLRATILSDFRHDLEASRYVKLLAETAGRAPSPAVANVLTES